MTTTALPTGRWIRFTGGEPRPPLKTRVWDVIARQGDVCLGAVAWDTAWRTYAFQPLPRMAFEQDCLRDIAAFVEAATAQHKAQRQAVRP